jgi:hypothetical protein
MKRSLEDRHTQTHGNVIEIFQSSQISFLNRRDVYEHTVKMVPCEFFHLGFNKLYFIDVIIRLCILPIILFYKFTYLFHII